jgi:tetratricopeptide (TPR) repeat protein
MVQFFLEWDWGAAEQSFQKAIELNPGYQIAHQGYAAELMALGRLDEAIEQMKWALRLSPFDLMSSISLGLVYATAGEYERARVALDRTLELFPDNAQVHEVLGDFHCERGRFEQGISMIRRAESLAGSRPAQTAALATCHALAGRPQEARALLQVLRKRSETEFVVPTLFAKIHVALREPDEALTLLERAYEMHFPPLPFLISTQTFSPLRKDVRYRDLLRRMGLRHD